jgi:hypothetical protein
MAEGQITEPIATCYGSPFEVYSTKDYPGLEASTELTIVRECHHIENIYLIILYLCSIFLVWGFKSTPETPAGAAKNKSAINKRFVLAVCDSYTWWKVVIRPCKMLLPKN